MISPPSSENVDAAASWLAAQDDTPHPIIPILQRQFGLTPKEAIDAAREAGARKTRAL